jgi:hypothetical protein
MADWPATALSCVGLPRPHGNEVVKQTKAIGAAQRADPIASGSVRRQAHLIRLA